TQVLVGSDGNLYGVADQGGMFNRGVVFQLTLVGSGWTESVIHDFSGFDADPRYLVQDSAGNLYGFVVTAPNIFTLQKTGSGWTFSELDIRHDDGFDGVNNLTIDPAGNLYGTGTYAIGTLAGTIGTPPGNGPRTKILPPRVISNYIFRASYDSAG